MKLGISQAIASTRTTGKLIKKGISLAGILLVTGATAPLPALERDIGAKHEYSNLGVGLLGRALARRVGKSWEEAVTARILEPLGMTDTRVTLTADMSRRLAIGHDEALGPVPLWDIPTFAGSGALRSTVNDMLKYLAANMDPRSKPLGEILAMTHASRRGAGSRKLTIGLCWHILHAPDGSNIVFHTGGTGGYRSFTGFDPAKHVGVVMLTNSAISTLSLSA
jgi:serine-type D-Ala-D-Ala carboxypeptidase/endopeptidase